MEEEIVSVEALKGARLALTMKEQTNVERLAGALCVLLEGFLDKAIEEYDDG